MSSISQVSEAMERILTTRAQELERETGFVQRSTAQLDGPVFAKTLVLCWLDNAEASYSQLRHVAASLGVQVSNQALEQRFGPASAQLLRGLLEEAIGEVLSSEQGTSQQVLSRFNGVYLQDGSIISLPASLADQWRGCGGSRPEAGASSLRVQCRLELSQGRLAGPWLQEGRASERSGEAMAEPVPVGALWDVDLGYFSLPDMRQLDQTGRYWLTQAKASLQFYDGAGQCWDLVSFLRAHPAQAVDVPVQLGKAERLPARLIAVRVPAEKAKQRRERANKSVESQPKGSQRLGRQPPAPRHGRKQLQRKRQHHRVSPTRLQLLEWTILLTNVPAELLSVQEAVVLARCRWQIELLWKLWKQRGQVDTWRSEKPSRILTEIYAKLLGCVMQHWLTLLGCWQAPNRSLVKAHQVVQWMTPGLALAWAGLLPVWVVVEHTTMVMATGCTINSRRKQPNTYQLLDNPKLIRGLG